MGVVGKQVNSSFQTVAWIRLVQRWMADPHSQSRCFHGSGVGSENLYFKQVLRQYRCCWSGKHILKTSGLYIIRNTHALIWRK